MNPSVSIEYYQVATPSHARTYSKNASKLPVLAADTKSAHHGIGLRIRGASSETTYEILSRVAKLFSLHRREAAGTSYLHLARYPVTKKDTELMERIRITVVQAFVVRGYDVRTNDDRGGVVWCYAADNVTQKGDRP